MKFKIDKIPSEVWKKHFAAQAHSVVFHTSLDPEEERIDYALLAISDQDVPLAYITCRELHRNHVYWQFGGAFPSLPTSIHTLKIYEKMRDYSFNFYNRIVTHHENTNFAILKLSMRLGFLITGIKYYKGSVFLENTLMKDAEACKYQRHFMG